MGRRRAIRRLDRPAVSGIMPVVGTMTEKRAWQIDVAKLARDILDRTRTANTGEDLKMRVDPLLRRAFLDIGVEVWNMNC